MEMELAITKLVDLAREVGLDEDAFDDDVYDAAGEGALPALNREESEAGQETVITAFERDASSINNGGWSAQFRFLLEGYASLDAGVKDLETRIRSRADG